MGVSGAKCHQFDGPGRSIERLLEHSPPQEDSHGRISWFSEWLRLTPGHLPN